MNRFKNTVEELLDGTGIELNGPKSYDPQIRNKAFYRRILREGSLGLGESYMEGWWDCDDLDIFFYRLFLSKAERKLPISLKVKLEIFGAFLLNQQSKSRVKKSIGAHYDLGNGLFENMLDPLMMYSCGYWEGVTSLDKAQENKVRLICEKLHLSPGETVLDIGCGWGGFAYYAAKNYGVKVLGITVSAEQRKVAIQRCQGLDVEIKLLDYREVKGSFDKIVSIGMFEHVGPKNYWEFMRIAHGNLKKEGICLLHFIGGNETVATTDPWINKYIFPNGVIPSLVQTSRAMERMFVLEDLHNLGRHYDPTLISWQRNFNHNWDKLKNQYDETFFRMWNYYLACCAASFRARRLNLWQLILIKPEYPYSYIPVR